MNRPTRREVLSRLSQWSAASFVAQALARLRPLHAQDMMPQIPALGTRPSTGLIDPDRKSLVSHILRKRVVDGTAIHDHLLREMIEEALVIATEQSDTRDAWNSLFAPDDVIAVKFNHVGAETLATTVPFTLQLIESFRRADISPERVMLIEAPRHSLIRQLKTRPVPFGYAGPELFFGSGKGQLAAALEEATAVLNVPFYKTHNIAILTGCLKNLSHAFISHPGRYHENACTPFVGDICALPQIREKVKLHIVNALRIVFTGGPEAEPNNFFSHGAVLASRDPVALDYLAVDIINDERVKRGLTPIGDANARIPHVHHAAQRGLGTDDQDYIRVIQPPLL